MDASTSNSTTADNLKSRENSGLSAARVELKTSKARTGQLSGICYDKLPCCNALCSTLCGDVLLLVAKCRRMCMFDCTDNTLAPTSWASPNSDACLQGSRTPCFSQLSGVSGQQNALRLESYSEARVENFVFLRQVLQLPSSETKAGTVAQEKRSSHAVESFWLVRILRRKPQISSLDKNTLLVQPHLGSSLRKYLNTTIK